MPKVLRNLFVLAACASLGTPGLAQVLKPYEATHEMSTPQGTMVTRTISDGQGKIRFDIISGMGANVSYTVNDDKAHTTFTVMPPTRTYLKMTYQPDKYKPFDKMMAAQYKAQDLGRKVIDGHPCHGYRYSASGATTESWVAEDIGVMVLSTSTGGGTTTTSKLKSYSAKAPGADKFSIPSGFQQMQIPSMPSGPSM